MDPIRIPHDDGTATLLPVTEKNYIALKKAYKFAIKEKLTEFKFKKSILLDTTFAHYMLEYMEMDPKIQAVMKSGE